MPEQTAKLETEPLSALEARVLGCLMEKESTTPDIYPLTLNALVNACNQRNNRAPVMSVGETEVKAALELLRTKQLVTYFAGADARVPKFRHKFDVVYPMEPVAKALMAELLLRGAQTTAGLRGNAERMQGMPDLAEVEAVLTDLAGRPAGALVRKLARQPGQKEARWAQLLTGEPTESVDASSGGGSGEGAARGEPLKVALTLPPEAEARIQALETQVAQLREELARLRAALGE
jgi:uncharacterized protein